MVEDDPVVVLCCKERGSAMLTAPPGAEFAPEDLSPKPSLKVCSFTAVFLLGS